MDNEDDDYDPDGFVDEYYDEIIRRRVIAHRTNWRMRYTSPSQREVALATNIEGSILAFGQFLVALILLTNQLLTAICMFCFYEVDTLLQEDDRLMNIRRWQWDPLAETPPRNQSIDELSDEDARSLTRFNKEQLRLL
jgi:hypothetical protein